MNAIIEKIKKLLRLAKSSEPHEAALAMRRARELMDKHGVTQAQIAMSNIREQMASAGNYKRPPMYVALLAKTVGSLFQCDFYWSTKPTWTWSRMEYRTSPVFVGMDPHQEIAAYVYDVLYRQLAKSRGEFETGYRSRGYITQARDSYALGWVEAIRRKVADMVPPRPTVQKQTGQGLVAVDVLKVYIDDKVDGEMDSRKRAIDDSALQDGYLDGQQVDIHKGMRRSDLKGLAAG